MNKNATRHGIAAATLQLLRSRGVGNFTIDDVASLAGVSRRTFFNYFQSAEAALTVASDEFLEAVLGCFEARPRDENIVESMLHALTEPQDPEQLAVMAELHAISLSSPEMMRHELQAWDRAEQRIVESVRQRLGEPADPLYVSCLVGSVLACGRSAFNEWQRRNAGAITPESVADLEALFVEAVGFLRHAFTR